LSDFNIILINLDGLRADRVKNCKTLDILKNESQYFSNMITAAPYTFASLHSIFSGMYPSKNGMNAYYNIFKFKKNEIITIPEILKKSGYYTCCDIISKVVIPNQGFDEINVFDEETVDFKQRHSELIDNLSTKGKFFLFLHFTETHKHLVKEIVKEYNQEDSDDEFFNSFDKNVQRYDSYLPSCDDYVSTILESLKKNKIEDKTILIFFSDHGTSLGEKKGEKFYGVFTYDYTIKVFCILKIPGNEPQKINAQSRTIDIFPTIIDIINNSSDSKIKNIQGKSLLNLSKEKIEREAFIETGGLYGPWPSSKEHNIFSIRKDNKKIIYNYTPKTWEFYDLEKDPNELKNIYNQNDHLIKEFKKRLSNNFQENNIDILIKY